MAWSPNSLLVASGSLDTTIIIWSVTNPAKHTIIKSECFCLSVRQCRTRLKPVLFFMQTPIRSRRSRASSGWTTRRSSRPARTATRRCGRWRRSKTTADHRHTHTRPQTPTPTHTHTHGKPCHLSEDGAEHCGRRPRHQSGSSPS